jgi:hypothetical protein
MGGLGLERRDRRGDGKDEGDHAIGTGTLQG